MRLFRTVGLILILIFNFDFDFDSGLFVTCGVRFWCCVLATRKEDEGNFHMYVLRVQLSSELWCVCLSYTYK
jgi:hypothetical protein